MTVRTGVIEVVEEAPRPEPDGGLGALRTERGNLPLELVEVRSSVAGLAVRTELAQGFHNPYDVPLEATYIFPLPDRAAVTRLRMEAADRVVDGVVKEREAARADYDAAIAEGKRASIAEEERPGVFTLRVGNIMPGERVVVRTSLTGRLPYEDGHATFRFPLVVAPRYIPGGALPGEQVGSGTAADTDEVPDASRISPPILLPGFPNPVRLSIEVAVDPVGLPLAGLTSSLHGVSVEEAGEKGAEGGDGARYLVRLNPGARADRDFVLRLGYGGPVAATSLAVAWDGKQGSEAAATLDSDSTSAAASVDSASASASSSDSASAPRSKPESDSNSAAATTGTFLLTILPPEPTGATRPRDVALVLDRSGSMAGWKMAAARRAAARIVDTLGAADRFVVLTFDDRMETPAELPSDGLVAATDRHRFRAVQHLAAVEARGGTEMEPPLRRAAALLTQDASDARDRVLILVTDGQVGNEDRLLTALTPKVERLRVHTVGVDSAVNAGFLRRLAALGGGHCELVESEDRLDEAMDAVHRRIGTPLVTGLRLAGVDGLELDQDSVTPARLPDLFVGAPLVVAGRLGHRTDAPAAESDTDTHSNTNTDSNTNADSGSRSDSDSDTTSPDTSPAILVTGQAADGTSWTRRVPAVETADAGLAQYWARGRIRDLEDRYVATYDNRPELERAIIATSVGHSVLSRFTAFVAIDKRVVNKTGVLKPVTQPVDLPAGWAEFDTDAGVPLYSAIGGAAEESADYDLLEYSVRSTKTVYTSRRAAGSAPAAAAPSGPPRSVLAPKPAPMADGTMAGGSPEPRAPMPLPTPPAPPAPGAPPAVSAPSVPSAPLLPPLPDQAKERVAVNEFQLFGVIWFAALKIVADDTSDAVLEETLTQFTARLRELAASYPDWHATEIADLLVVLEDSDKPVGERRQSVIAFLEAIQPPTPPAEPRRTPFWKR